MIEKLLEGYEPFGDTTSNKVDRRLLFEVTGLQLFENEFKDDTSSESDSDSEQLPSDRQVRVVKRISTNIVNSDTESDD